MPDTLMILYDNNNEEIETIKIYSTIDDITLVSHNKRYALNLNNLLQLINEKQPDKEYSFTGSVIEILNEAIIVQADDYNEEVFNGKFIIKLSENNQPYKIGDKLRITYTGVILESNPAQIEVINIDTIN